MKAIIGFAFFLLFIAGIAFVTMQGKQLGQFGAKIGALTLNNFVLVVIATITMAIARFV